MMSSPCSVGRTNVRPDAILSALDASRELGTPGVVAEALRLRPRPPHCRWRARRRPRSAEFGSTGRGTSEERPQHRVTLAFRQFVRSEFLLPPMGLAAAYYLASGRCRDRRPPARRPARHRSSDWTTLSRER